MIDLSQGIYSLRSLCTVYTVCSGKHSPILDYSGKGSGNSYFLVTNWRYTCILGDQAV